MNYINLLVSCTYIDDIILPYFLNVYTENVNLMEKKKRIRNIKKKQIMITS